jgi:hypothetical protein
MLGFSAMADPFDREDGHSRCPRECKPHSSPAISVGHRTPMRFPIEAMSYAPRRRRNPAIGSHVHAIRRTPRGAMIAAVSKLKLVCSL